MVENLNWHENKFTPATEPRPIGMPIARHERQPVGSDLKYVQDRLLELGSKLMRETYPEASGLIAKALEALKSQVLRVSVVGQVNAGKTTLVNALAGQPYLLPVSSEPWTAVVTRLHFGLPGYPQPCSNFQFFDDREWQRLAEQGGKLRELAERFLPGFNSEQLQRQIQAMRYHAQARLGSSFEDFLGSHHSFSSINPAIIARYVTTGSVTPPNSGGREPHYADITRSADLFFDAAPFGYPLTLIDTPGTNDPFLVREEMTLRCLDASNVCIVVIDATKGLTEADLGLFRLLNGINAQRLIVFINKVDLLKGSTEDVEKVTRDITSSVYRELGSSIPPVIVGSAQHAQLTVQNSDREDVGINLNLNRSSPSPVGKQAGSILMAIKIANGANVIDDNLSSFKGPHGLGALEDAISKMMRRGQAAHYIHQTSATLQTLADGIRSQAAYQINSYKNELDIHKADLDQQVKVQRALSYLQNLAEQMTRTTDTTISSLHHLSESYEQHAQANLQRLVASYAALTKKEFLKKHRRKLPAKAVHFDTNKLRAQIFVANEKDYRGVRREMANCLRSAAAQLMFLMNQVQSDMDVEINFDSVSSDFVSPSQSPLGRTLAIDLGEPYWRRWWRRRTTTAEVADSLEALILQEFTPLVADLVDLTKGELETVIENSVLQLSISASNMVQSVRNQQLAIAPPGQQTRVEDNRALDLQARDPQTAETSKQPVNPGQLQYQIDIANSRHQRVEKLVREFRSLTDACQKLLTGSEVEHKYISFKASSKL